MGRPERVPWESRAFTTWSPAHRPIAQAQDLSVKRQDNTCVFGDFLWCFIWFYDVHPDVHPPNFEMCLKCYEFLCVEQPSLTIKMKLGMNYPPSVVHDCSAFASTHAAYLFLPHFRQLLDACLSFPAFQNFSKDNVLAWSWHIESHWLQPILKKYESGLTIQNTDGKAACLENLIKTSSSHI